MRPVVLLALLILGGCAAAPALKLPLVEVSGPKFARAQFDCGGKPLPPDPAKATGKSAAVYENRLGAWGQGCSDKLGAIAAPLEAAGQVEGK